MAKMVKCEDCVYMYRCERTYLGECDVGVEWGDCQEVVVGEISGKEKDGDES